VGCGVLLLVLLAGFLYTRYKKFKNTVIIKVYRVSYCVTLVCDSTVC